MDKEHVTPKNPDKSYGSGERIWPQAGNKNSRSPIQKMDAAIEEKINHALWKDAVLRATDNNEIDIHVKNGIISIREHMVSTTNRQRVEKVLQTVEGIHGSKSNLVMDDDLMREVAAL